MMVSCRIARRSRRVRVVLPFLLLAAIVATSGCRTARAATPVERPNLEVPPPPPRIIEPALAPELPPEAPPEPPAPGTAGTARPRPAQSAPKPETKPEPPPDTPPASTTPPASPPQLRTPGMASGPEAARQIQAILTRAGGMLRSINFMALSRERQNSYRTAERFIEEGQRELKATNYVLAKELAEKAERLAKELQSRWP